MDAKNAQLVTTHRNPQAHAATTQRPRAQACQTTEDRECPPRTDYDVADAVTLQFEYALSDELENADIELEYVLLMNMAMRDAGIVSADNNDMKGDTIKAPYKMPRWRLCKTASRESSGDFRIRARLQTAL